MTYKVVDNGDTFSVEEKDTGLILIKNVSNRRARGYCRSLNLGSGFKGITPSFFCIFNEKGCSESATP